MKTYLLPSIRMTGVMLVLCCGLYFGLITLIGKAAPGGGDGVTVQANGKTVGYANIGQKFTEDKYFWSRPSAVDYNAAGSAGSNKATSNPDYLKTMQERIDTCMAHNPGVAKSEIPADMVTASGSGLDPHISPQGAYIQVARIAKARGVAQNKVKALVEQHVEKHTLGPDVVNVLQLNVALDAMKWK